MIFINIQGKGIGRYRLSEIKFDKQEKIEIEKRHVKYKNKTIVEFSTCVFIMLILTIYVIIKQKINILFLSIILKYYLLIKEEEKELFKSM